MDYKEEKTYAQEIILKRIENKNVEHNFQDCSDDCYSDYIDDSEYGDSSGSWN